MGVRSPGWAAHAAWRDLRNRCSGRSFPSRRSGSARGRRDRRSRAQARRRIRASRPAWTLVPQAEPWPRQARGWEGIGLSSTHSQPRNSKSHPHVRQPARRCTAGIPRSRPPGTDHHRPRCRRVRAGAVHERRRRPARRPLALERLAEPERPGDRAVRAAQVRCRNPVADPARCPCGGSRRGTATLPLPQQADAGGARRPARAWPFRPADAGQRRDVRHRRRCGGTRCRRRWQAAHAAHRPGHRSRRCHGGRALAQVRPATRAAAPAWRAGRGLDPAAALAGTAARLQREEGLLSRPGNRGAHAFPRQGETRTDALAGCRHRRAG